MRVQLLGIIAASALTISQAMAQQPADQPSGAAPIPIVGRTAAAIAAEGQHTGTFQRYQDRKLFAEHGYYLWRDGCYLRQTSGDFVSVPLASCR
jgi:hypothetical protein